MRRNSISNSVNYYRAPTSRLCRKTERFEALLFILFGAKIFILSPFSQIGNFPLNSLSFLPLYKLYSSIIKHQLIVLIYQCFVGDWVVSSIILHYPLILFHTSPLLTGRGEINKSSPESDTLPDLTLFMIPYSEISIFSISRRDCRVS